jgi:osmotically-inducible protein OsmY
MAVSTTSPYANRTDDDIQRDVLAELEWDARVSPNELGVVVRDGVVTLTGTVNSYVKQWAAGDAALRVRGVQAVANQVEVRLEPTSERSDDSMAADAVRALEGDAVLARGKLKVKLAKGWLTLSGEVEWYYQKLDAERVVRRLRGVKGVTNLIVVRPAVNSLDIKAEIERALVRSAQTDAKNIELEVKGGRVVLKGTVRSVAESHDAERVAWLGPGVTEVDNQLLVSPY